MIPFFIFKAFYCFYLLFLVKSSEPDSPQSLDPCRRQPFRGRCPPGPNGVQMRSQFVLRYYLRNGECISYPYGHCINDENEPRLYRYKEECEDACKGSSSAGKEVTYATAGPFNAETTTTKVVVSTDTTIGTNILKTTTTEAPKTDCQLKRENAEKQGNREGIFIPTCTLEGQFSPLQCMPNGNECFCVDKAGIELKHSRTKDNRKPDCEKIASISSQPVLVQDCTSLPDPGPCTSNIPYWTFNEANGHCSIFNYSGCGGNGNKFGSRLECEQRCLSSKKCPGGQLPLKDAQGLLVDCSNSSCPPSFSCHLSICCQLIVEKEPSREQAPILEGGTTTPIIKIFEETSTISLPKNEENNINVCSLPKDRGSCDQYQMRFYFNKEIGECKYFFYGGCEGNSNNFARVEDCEKACVKPSEWKEKVEQGKSENIQSFSSSSPVQTTTTSLKTRTTSPSPTQINNEPDTPKLLFTTFRPEKPDSFFILPGRKEQQKQQQPSPSLLALNRCQHPKDIGECAAQFVRWFWNSDLHNCESFTYSGCGGNGNNFASREECLNVCREEEVVDTTDDSEKSVCDVDIDPGNCGGIFMRYGFDKRALQCRQFQYGGCGGNGNNFASLLDCRRRCLDEPEEPLSPNICDHRIDSGGCSGSFHRFGYDPITNRCTKFVYGGCGGNGNNFASIDDCRAACVRHICPPEPECDTSGRCQLVKDSKGCSLCSCPPPRHPPVLIPSAPPLAPPVELRTSNCPQLDVKLCQEPCIIFLNRRGCRECVCPIISQPDGHDVPSPPSTGLEPSPSPPAVQSISIHQQQQPRPDLSSSGPLPPPSFSSSFVFSSTSAPAPPAIHPPKLGGVPSNKALEPLPPPTTESSATRSTSLITKRLFQTETFQTSTPEPIAFGHNDICTQPLDIGASACNRFVQRWYFSSESGQCESFSYTGCAGNRNHFFSKKECQIYCARFSRSRTTSTVSGDDLLPIGSQDVEPIASQSSSIPITTTTTTTLLPTVQNLFTREEDHTEKETFATSTIIIIKEQFPENKNNKLPIDEINNIKDGDFEEEKEEKEIFKSSTLLPSLAPTIDSRVILKSRIVPEAPIKNELFGVPNEKQILIKIPEISHRIEQSTIIPIIFENNKNVESTDTLKNLHAPSTTTTTTTTTRSQIILNKEEIKNNKKEQSKLDVFSIAIPKEKIENLDELSTQITVKNETIYSKKVDEKQVNEIENKIKIGEGKEEQKIDLENEKGETISESLDTFSSLSTILNPTTTTTSSTSNKIIPKLQTIKIVEIPISSNLEENVEEEEEIVTTTIAKMSEEEKEVGDNDFIWVPGGQEGDEKRKFKNIKEIKKETEKEVKEGKNVEEGLEEEETFPLENSSPLPLEEGFDKETNFEGNHQPPPPLPPIPQNEKKSEDNSNVFGDNNEQQQIPIKSNGEDVEQKQEQQEEILEEVTSKTPVVEEQRRQPLAIISQEKDKEEVKTIEEPLDNANTSTGDSQFEHEQPELLPLDNNNEFSPQSSTINNLATEIPLRLAPQSPPVNSPSRQKLQRPQIPPVQHMIIPNLQNNKHEICSLPPVAGPCTSFVLRWFFNPESGICEQFSYGSCRGNLNNFPDRAQCEAICLDIPQVRLDNRCTLDKDEGTGTGYNIHWYFNVRNLRCEQFIWQGNDGNANRFDSESECKSICEQAKMKETDELINIPPPAGRMRGGEKEHQQRNREEENSNNQIDNQLRGSKTAETQNEIGDVGMPAPFHPIDEVAKSIDNEPTTTSSLDLMSETSNSESEPNFEQFAKTSLPPPPGYSANSLSKEPLKIPDNLPPIIGPSMPAEIDYGTGTRFDNNQPPPPPLVVSGLPQHIPEQNKANKNIFPTQFNDEKGERDPLFSLSKTVGTIANGVPICPNGLNTMLYSDGRPVLCLPGMGQCPEKSVCYFNGIDYFCCPNEDDPYDQHIFGGYDGEELKHGYKAGSQQSSLRIRRQNAQEQVPASQLSESLRFDDKPPPGPVQRQSRFHGKGLNPICYQPLNKGKCAEALPRYFYDANLDRCRPFYFTGCDGNDNKFGTIIECERSCKRGVELSENILSQKRPGVCPGGNLPLGGRNPVLCGEHFDSIGCPTGFLCVPGPPSVCCPTNFEKNEIRRKPQQNINTDEQMLEVKPAAQEEKNQNNNNIAELNVNLMLCSDGSDPLRNETSGEIISCGAGLDIDGQAHCERGFYCSIDPDSNTRFCCPLQAQGVNLDSGSNPSTESIAPHFGRRPPNPGEVLPKGSLPSDRHRISLSSSSRRNSSSRSNVEFGHLRIEREQLGVNEKEKNTRLLNSKTKSNNPDWRQSEDDPFESAAVCLLRPDEGRLCAKGERNPRSNLQYFYNSKEGRCKVFFQKGCGGNGNKFESKEECERRCSKR